jgi:hypothetical protein
MKCINLFFGPALLLMLACVPPNGEADILKYAVLFDGKRMPTVSDYREAYGAVDQNESDFELLVCELKGWPDPTNAKSNPCSKYMRDRQKRASQIPSMYLKWLRSILPKNPKIKVLRKELVQSVDGKIKYLPYEIVYAKFDGVDVKMRRAIDAKEVEVTGKIFITEIGGVPVTKLVDDFLERQRKCKGCEL